MSRNQSLRLSALVAASIQKQRDEADEESSSETPFAITDEQHYRSELISVGQLFHLSTDQIVTGDEGLLRHSNSMAEESVIENFENSIKAEDTPLLKQSSSRQAEIRLIHSTLEEIDNIAEKRIRDGFNERNFTLGVVNTLVVLWVFGMYPQHFWLLYIIEGCYLLPSRLYSNCRTKPLNSALFFLDFCWQMNLLALVVLMVFVVDALVGISGSDVFHKQLYLAPFVCLMFHDVKSLAGFFIHMFPPLVMYTLLWNADDIRNAWPRVFYLDYMDDVSFFVSGEGTWPLGLGSVAGNTLALYGLWWTLYVAFVLVVGMDLPRYDRNRADDTLITPRFDTVFHRFQRAGLCVAMGSLLWNRPKSISLDQMESNHYETRDFLVYMLVHAIMATAGVFCIGLPCFLHQRTHASFLVAVVIVTIYRGAKRYTYYSTQMYSKTLRKQFAHLIDEENIGQSHTYKEPLPLKQSS